MVDIKTSLTGHKRVTEYHALNLPPTLSSLLSEWPIMYQQQQQDGSNDLCSEFSSSQHHLSSQHTLSSLLRKYWNYLSERERAMDSSYRITPPFFLHSNLIFSGLNCYKYALNVPMSNSRMVIILKRLLAHHQLFFSERSYIHYPMWEQSFPTYTGGDVIQCVNY